MAATVGLVHGSFLGPWSWRDVVAGPDLFAALLAGLARSSG
ncbi:hypothetical protein [Saccharopolyspora sp. ASAGF58]|nr:hypothetical protein [Saccharopolyspora sp. ASAGF58]